MQATIDSMCQAPSEPKPTPKQGSCRHTKKALRDDSQTLESVPSEKAPARPQNVLKMDSGLKEPEMAQFETNRKESPCILKDLRKTSKWTNMDSLFFMN